MRSERAVSEIIGAILLVAIVLAGIGIVAVFMTSTPPPQAKDKSVLTTSCIDCSGDTFAIVLRHEGGDAIDPRMLKYWLKTKYQNGTPFERIEVYGSYFFLAEEFSRLSKEEVCSPPPGSWSIAYNNATVMKNGDVAVVSYKMKR